MKIPLSLVLAIGCLCLHAGLRAASPFDSKTIKVNADGTFNIGDLDFGVVLYDATYVGEKQDVVKPDAGNPKISAAKWETAGLWSSKKGAGPFAFQETISRESETSYRVKYHLKNTTAAPLNIPLIVACQTLLPGDVYAQKTLALDDADLSLAPSDGKPVMFDKWGAEQVVIPTAKGKLMVRGDLKIHVQDDRPWQDENFKMWFPIATAQQPAPEADLELTFDLAPAKK